MRRARTAEPARRRAGEREPPSKTVAEMVSSTTATAKGRLLLARAAPARRSAGTLQPRALAGLLCSAAGAAHGPWQQRLRRALKDELFVLHYQPIVSLEDG